MKMKKGGGGLVAHEHVWVAARDLATWRAHLGLIEGQRATSLTLNLTWLLYRPTDPLLCGRVSQAGIKLKITINIRRYRGHDQTPFTTAVCSM